MTQSHRVAVQLFGQVLFLPVFTALAFRVASIVFFVPNVSVASTSPPVVAVVILTLAVTLTVLLGGSDPNPQDDCARSSQTPVLGAEAPKNLDELDIVYGPRFLALHQLFSTALVASAVIPLSFAPRTVCITTSALVCLLFFTQLTCMVGFSTPHALAVCERQYAELSVRARQ